MHFTMGHKLSPSMLFAKELWHSEVDQEKVRDGTLTIEVASRLSGISSSLLMNIEKDAYDQTADLPLQSWPCKLAESITVCLNIFSTSCK
jgi:hypothetical protein